jgi:lipoprotein-releasing system ATP-binding protein
MFSLIQRVHRSHGLTSILVTHNQELAGRCDRVMRLEAGRMTEDFEKTGKPYRIGEGGVPETSMRDNRSC